MPPLSRYVPVPPLTGEQLEQFTRRVPHVGAPPRERVRPSPR